jgi:hypothetical protein
MATRGETTEIFATIRRDEILLADKTIQNGGPWRAINLDRIILYALLLAIGEGGTYEVGETLEYYDSDKF